MQKVFIPLFIIATGALLLFSFVVMIREKRNLTRERNELILKNDSLHIQILEIRKKEAALQKKLDSLSK